MERGKIGVVGDGELRQFLRDSHIHPRYYQDLEPALTDFNNNRIDAVIVIPPTVSSGSEIVQLKLYLPASDIRGTLVTLQLKKPLRSLNPMSAI